MKTYKIKFRGRKNHAIGKHYTYWLTIQAENFEAAKLKMYDTHEHIFLLTVNGKPYSYKHPETKID